MAVTKTARTLQGYSAGNNAAGATLTGSAFDQSTALGISGTARITNGGTGPTIGCSFILEVSNDNTNWFPWMTITAGITASAVMDIPWSLPADIKYVRSKFTGNTGQAVSCECHAHELTTV